MHARDGSRHGYLGERRDYVSNGDDRGVLSRVCGRLEEEEGGGVGWSHGGGKGFNKNDESDTCAS